VSECGLAGILISIRVGLVDGSERQCLGLLPDFLVANVDGRLSINGKSWGSSDRLGEARDANRAAVHLLAALAAGHKEAA
jgi:hypothetical protein